MRNREQYQDFLKCLSLFSEDIISKHELLNLIVDSLSRHPDLQVHPPSLSLSDSAHLQALLESVYLQTDAHKTCQLQDLI